MYTILLIILILALIGGLPRGPWWGAAGSGYGWGPSGGIGLILVIVVLFMLFGR